MPLSPSALQILLALAAQDLHGHGIIQAVAEQSDGRVRIGPGTLYDHLKRFMDQGLVCDVPPTAEEERRLYRLTSGGRTALTAEVSRLDQVVRQARRYLPGLKPRRVE